MFRKMALLFALTAFCCIAASAQAADQWQTFKSENGKFSVLMPCKPAVEAQEVKSDDGPVKQAFHSCENRTGYFMVTFVDYPKASKEKAMLDAYRDNGLKSTGSKVVTEAPLTLDTYPGREIVANGLVDKSEVVFNWRIYLVDKRIYALTAATTKENSKSPDISKFMSSFSLVK